MHLDYSQVYAPGAKFDGADFSNGIVDRAFFKGSSFRGTIFNNAVLSGTSFEEADLTEADFTDACASTCVTMRGALACAQHPRAAANPFAELPAALADIGQFDQQRICKNPTLKGENPNTKAPTRESAGCT